MSEGAILAYMLEYFQKGNPTLTAESLAEQNVLTLLTDSLDVVEFLMFMEDKLGLDTQFELSQVRANLVNSNFRELAGEILRRLPAASEPA
jgi:acyl carrier protein